MKSCVHGTGTKCYFDEKSGQPSIIAIKREPKKNEEVNTRSWSQQKSSWPAHQTVGTVGDHQGMGNSFWFDPPI